MRTQKRRQTEKLTPQTNGPPSPRPSPNFGRGGGSVQNPPLSQSWERGAGGVRARPLCYFFRLAKKPFWIAFLLLSLLYLPSPVFADNCSGLSDCFSGNMMPALWLLLGLILLVAMSWYLLPLLLGFTIAPALQSVIAPAGKSSIALTIGEFMNKFLSRNKRAPTPCLPTITLKVEKELEINYEKVAPYIKHTPQYLERIKAGDPAPYFDDPTQVEQLIRDAWQKGKPASDNQTRHHDFERPIGRDPKDNPLTRLTVHQEPEGKLYGYPS